MNLNITGLFSRGYRIIQSGEINFSLINLNTFAQADEQIVEFEVDSLSDSVGFIHERLLKEIDYTIKCIEENDKDFFAGADDEAKENIKTVYLDEIKLIGDILR